MRYAAAFIELGGFAAIGYGAYELAPWLGWIVAGAAAILVGQAIGGRPT